MPIQTLEDDEIDPLDPSIEDDDEVLDTTEARKAAKEAATEKTRKPLHVQLIDAQ